MAGLLPKDELDMIVNDIRPVMKHHMPGVPDTWDNLYAFFLNRVRDNLHCVLCFSPVGAKFSRRAQQFPGLINGCTIDWFLPWPEEALTSVSGKFIDEFKMACEPAIKDSLKLMMGHVHVYVTAACLEYFEKFRRHVYVTPKSYLSFIQGYKELYGKKWESTQVRDTPPLLTLLVPLPLLTLLTPSPPPHTHGLATPSTPRLSLLSPPFAGNVIPPCWPR